MAKAKQSCMFYGQYSMKTKSCLDANFLSLVHWLNSVNQVSIGSDNGSLPVRCQAITCSNAGLLSIGLLGSNFTEISLSRNYIIFIQENASEIVVC